MYDAPGAAGREGEMEGLGPVVDSTENEGMRQGDSGSEDEDEDEDEEDGSEEGESSSGSDDSEDQESKLGTSTAK